MTSKEWSVTDIKFGDYSSLRHKITGELGFFSKKGQIWFQDDLTLRVMHYRGSYEKVDSYPIEMIEEIFDAFEIPRASEFQLNYCDRIYYNNPMVDTSAVVLRRKCG